MRPDTENVPNDADSVRAAVGDHDSDAESDRRAVREAEPVVLRLAVDVAVAMAEGVANVADAVNGALRDELTVRRVREIVELAVRLVVAVASGVAVDVAVSIAVPVRDDEATSLAVSVGDGERLGVRNVAVIDRDLECESVGEGVGGNVFVRDSVRDLVDVAVPESDGEALRVEVAVPEVEPE